MSHQSLETTIKSAAHRLGFQLAGITTADPPPHLDVYTAWLESGRQAGMTWMGSDRNRQRRADPHQIFPECESIIVLGVPYNPGAPKPPSDGLVGRVASYAWGDDYHDIFPARLAALVGIIEQQVGASVPNRWYTDTGPVLEREFAQRAGLGWIGKNTCLINPNAGSYFLLAEILFGLPLTPDRPIVQDHCGSCTRCIDACPTSCILPDRTIDSNRCISYLTIEEKGFIPADLREGVGDWVFGCDICQQVCPWNQRFATAPETDLLPPRAGVPASDLIQELTLTPQAFNRKFKGSPVKRTKRRGYLRNISIALGNAREPEAVPALAAALNDFEPLVRGHAAWALGKTGGQAAQAALSSALATENDDTVRAEIQAALQA